MRMANFEALDEQAKADHCTPAVTHPHVLRLTPYYYLPARSISRAELQYEPIGGMQVQIAQATEQLDQLGVRQTVVMPRRPGLPPKLAVGEQADLRLLRLPVAPLRSRAKGYVGLLVSWGLSVSAWSIGCRLRRGGRPFSLIHVHCSELPWTFAFAVLVRSVLRRPLVLTTHCSAIVTFHPETLAGRLLALPARMAERFAVRRADAVIVLTERVKRAYVLKGLADPERVFVVPDGVRLDLFRPARGDAATASGSAPIVLYCGRFAPEKGWADMIAAARLLIERGCPARFQLCGDGNELPRCRRELRKLGLAQRVELLGHLDRAEVAELMARAAVVVVPSRHEELGGTVLEALASARAVVATKVGGLPEVITHGVNGLLVPPYDPPRLAEAISRLVSEPALRSELGAAGARRVRRFDARIVAAETLSVYRRTLGQATHINADA